MKLRYNSSRSLRTGLPASLRRLVSAESAEECRRLLQACPAYRATPLLVLPAQAARLGLSSVLWKDEGRRLGLTSFKALGGAHAVFRMLGDRLNDALGREPAPDDWFGPVATAIACDLTVVTATAGNHGLSVAAGARVLGIRCVIFVSETVDAARRRRLTDAGAEVRIEGADFDQSVRAAQRTASEDGFQLVADTSYVVEDRNSGRVLQGYGVIALEIIDELNRTGMAPPTHLFVQAGVGGLAASLAGIFSDQYGADRPDIIVVEPDKAGALYASIERGDPIRVPGVGVTNMDMLACYEPSALPWAILRQIADAFVTISDEAAAEAMLQLSRPDAPDVAILASPTAAAGLAGLIAVLESPDAATRLQLNDQSRVLLIGSEAALPCSTSQGSPS